MVMLILVHVLNFTFCPIIRTLTATLLFLFHIFLSNQFLEEKCLFVCLFVCLFICLLVTITINWNSYCLVKGNPPLASIHNVSLHIIVNS